MQRQRGRPKEYDPATALGAAGAVFWAQGFSGTSLDDLASAMGMNRPSIYRAFGDKHTIYRLAMAQFAQRMEDGFQQTVMHEPDLSAGLTGFYRAALEVYYGGEQALGCMVMCTAPAAAIAHPDVQSDLLEVIETLDAHFLERLEQARQDGQLAQTTDIDALSKLLQAVLHTLAIRARAGAPKASLQRFADHAVMALLGDG